MTIKLMAGALTIALLVLAGCGSKSDRSDISPPVPAAGDVEGQIMSVTGADFTICGASQTSQVDQPIRYDVTVCGDVTKARSALEDRFPGKCVVHANQAGDGGRHTPEELVVQWWVSRAAGTGWKVTFTEITEDGHIDVGVDGDLNAA